ncbi:MAG: AAA family ATPase [Bermanella sp.]
MHLTKLSLKNFRSFSEEQTIDFAPITLLFGPNSVGKSSVLMALFYLQQILDKGECNPKYLDALGYRNVGGFKNLVHGRDVERKIVIKLHFNKVDDYSENFSFDNVTSVMRDDETLNSFLEREELNIEPILEQAEEFAVAFEISWSFSKKTAYVSTIVYAFDDIEMVRLSSDENLKNPQISAFNLVHPYTYTDEQLGNINEIVGLSRLGNLLSRYDLSIDFNLNKEELRSRLDFSSDCKNEYNKDYPGKTLILPFRSRVGALPHTDRFLSTTFEHENNFIDSIVHETLSNTIVSPLRKIKEYLSNSLCIGPLRHIPDSDYLANPYIRQSDWYDGKAAWDYVKQADIDSIDKINKHLSKSKLNIGCQFCYSVEDVETRLVKASLEMRSIEDFIALNDAIPDSLKVSISDANNKNDQALASDDIEDVRKEHDIASDFYLGVGLNKNVSVELYDLSAKQIVSASEVGSGVSQIMPLVVAAAATQGGIIACEQPELHVHPRIQVGLGDFLIEHSRWNSDDSSKTTQFLIETHSEHLILRLLKRIRQTTDGELPSGNIEITNQDISIMYLEAYESGVKAKRLHIDQDGEFNQRWPGGFFTERSEELF